MSFSVCINCGNPVSMYEKYCLNCEKGLHLKQDPNWHKTHSIWNLAFELKRDRDPGVHHIPISGSVRNLRVPCLGGCGELVLKKIGECRKCRRARVLQGKRRIVKLEKGQ